MPLITEHRRRLEAASAANEAYNQAVGASGGIPQSTQQDVERIRKKEMATLLLQVGC
jgi:uncharacterized protein YwqG